MKVEIMNCGKKNDDRKVIRRKETREEIRNGGSNQEFGTDTMRKLTSINGVKLHAASVHSIEERESL